MIVTQRTMGRAVRSERATVQAENQGYGREKIHLSMVIGVRGQLLGVENLQTVFTRRSDRLMAVPQSYDDADPAPVNFLWDKTGSALGVRRRRGLEGVSQSDDAAFRRFKFFHRAALLGISDMGVEAFLKFLDEWSPDQAKAHAEVLANLDHNVVFRFQYDDGFLHERPAARAAWRYLLGQRRLLRLSA